MGNDAPVALDLAHLDDDGDVPRDDDDDDDDNDAADNDDAVSRRLGHCRSGCS